MHRYTATNGIFVSAYAVYIIMKSGGSLDTSSLVDLIHVSDVKIAQTVHVFMNNAIAMIQNWLDLSL